jgi:hypothetical protein
VQDGMMGYFKVTQGSVPCRMYMRKYMFCIFTDFVSVLCIGITQVNFARVCVSSHMPAL